MTAKNISEETKFSRKSASLLRQERERRGWSQSDVARRIGMHRLNISRWENGITTPSPYHRQKLGELFEKSLHDLGLLPDGSDATTEGIATISQAPGPALPIWNVPYRRNPYFTGRETLLAYLYNVLRSKKVIALTQALAISGLGGIGKSQIALEYAYRYSKQYKAIFWINASSHEVSVADFVALAALLNLPERHEPDQQIIVRAIKRWMTANSKWLLILDGVDKLEAIVDYLPRDKVGDILITTRLQALGTVAQSIEVGNMSLDESVIFLLRRAKLLAPGASLEDIAEESQAQAVEIVTALGGLPLAIDQAGAYIEETHCGLSQFASLFDLRRKELLMRRGSFQSDHPDSVVATWSLSFQQVEHESQAAADLLYLLAFLNPEAIPNEIITLGSTEPGHSPGSTASDPMVFDAVIELLLRYSLIQRNSEANCLSIHRLVQAVLKDSMSSDTQLLWAERTIRAVYQVFSRVELKTIGQCQRYLPHIIACAKVMDEFHIVFPESGQMLNDMAEYLLEQGEYKQAEWLLQRALAVRQEILEAHHPDIARTLNNLGVCYRDFAEYTLAEQFHERALAIQEHVLGLDHEDVAQTQYNLARLYRAQGLYVKAEPFYLRALHIRKRTLGGDHHLVAQSYYGLAKLYHSLMRYEEAETLCERALTILESSLEKKYHLIASTLSILAKVYLEQNRLDLAEEMCRSALEIRENISGPDHPQIASITNDLISVYFAQGRERETEPLISRSLKIHEQSLGTEHPYSAYGLSNKAESFFLRRKYGQAEIYYKKALAIREQNLGMNHPRTASTYDRLMALYSIMGRYEEAESFCLKALAVWERAFGPDHLIVARTLERYAALLSKLGRESEAYELEVRVRIIRTGK